MHLVTTVGQPSRTRERQWEMLGGGSSPWAQRDHHPFSSPWVQRGASPPLLSPRVQRGACSLLILPRQLDRSALSTLQSAPPLAAHEEVGC